MTTSSSCFFVVYTLDEKGKPYDMCGKRKTKEAAEKYLGQLKKAEAKLIVKEKYAIYMVTETRIA